MRDCSSRFWYCTLVSDPTLVVCQPPTPLSSHVSSRPICIAATKTIAWSTHTYKPLTLKAGTLVTFKWSGFHDVAVCKLNEKSTRSECLKLSAQLIV